MGWVVAGLLALLNLWLLKANYRAEKRWRALRYSWTKLARDYIQDPTGDEWPDIARTNIDRHREFLRRFDLSPLSTSGIVLYEEALAERSIDPID